MKWFTYKMIVLLLIMKYFKYEKYSYETETAFLPMGC